MRKLAALMLMIIGSAAQAAPDAVEVAASLGLKAEGGQVINACDEAVTPTLTPVELGGAVGTAQLLVIPGGPSTLTCYGDIPGDMHLLVADGAGWRSIFNGGGFLIVMPGSHDGVHDFALGGPGFSFPVFQWDGESFTAGGKISDEDLQALGELPTFP
ncbi:hypothetical protein [Tabrizicola sp.]|uniref:hypothetical protein n=1 Tax=Tabrizicola sp. TaxID=2005166 RepID=UPI001A520AAA|nr:hypothetical protein [Tabrizicola sp.]MBL9075143.1 hypothetical protein [Tabrizicola sp.]